MIFKIVGHKTMIVCSIFCVCVTLLVVIFALKNSVEFGSQNGNVDDDKKIIKYAEFNVTYDALEKAFKYDINSYYEETKFNWIDVLSYLAAKYGGDFKDHYKEKDMEKLIETLKSGKSMEDLTKKMKYYNYYHEVYSAVLGEFVGNYKIQVESAAQSGEPVFEEKYGLKVFSPIAKTFPFEHFQDFGSSRTYGFSRPHLGNDLMAAVGTPIIAIESGLVEAIGWNKYGGWRIGIRSFDKKRYYYYAHLRKNKPYVEDMKEGKLVKAGDVIGYVGRTGYSTKENVNNIEESHLHLGLELIFDESQKECDNEIWIDVYALVNLLQKNRSEVVRNPETKQYSRKYDFEEESLKKFLRETA